METPHNKLIEEKFSAIEGMLLKDDDIQQVLLSKYFGSDQEKQEIVAIGLRDKKLLAALDELKAFISDLLATREAQIYRRVLAALRPQQQEEVSN